MKSYKLSIRYIIAKNKLRKDGKSPIFARLTYLKQRKQFATGLFIDHKHWKSKVQQAKPPNEANNIINTQLSLISQKINEAFLLLQVQHQQFNVNDIYKQFKGENISKEMTLLEAYDLHNNKMKKLIGIDFNELSWSRYIENKRKVESFLKQVYKRTDMKLKDLDLKFIKDLEYHFKTDLKLSQATINRSIQRVRKVILFAIAENHLDKDPFVLYKPTKYRIKVVYLTPDELKLLEGYQFSQKRLSQVRDLFIFCCYTGLAYKEMANLRKHHIITGFDRNLWIEMTRQKTDKEISIPLLPKPLQLLEKYDYELPVISNQKFNSYLKEIAAVIGVEKRLTHHTARKTFATTVLLYNNVPMEVVSELLGHSKMDITQKHYGKVVKQKVSIAISNLIANNID